MTLKSKGFSLVELVMVLGLTGLGALGISSVMTMQAKTVNNLSGGNDYFQMRSTLVSALADPQSCLITFGLSPTTSPPNLPPPGSSIPVALHGANANVVAGKTVGRVGIVSVSLINHANLDSTHASASLQVITTVPENGVQQQKTTSYNFVAQMNPAAGNQMTGCGAANTQATANRQWSCTQVSVPGSSPSSGTMVAVSAMCPAGQGYIAAGGGCSAGPFGTPGSDNKDFTYPVPTSAGTIPTGWTCLDNDNAWLAWVNCCTLK